MSRAKRAFDVAGASLGLLALAPLFVLVAALIKLQDGGPAFFRQVRVGRHGRRFRIWKFRTMVMDAERRGGTLTVGDDPRITRLGRMLRSSRIDEPQLLNVLAGEMSLIGRRPEVPKYADLYGPFERSVLGLTPRHDRPRVDRISAREHGLGSYGRSGSVLCERCHAGQDQAQSGIRRAT
jgi:lipopolysaccharide/colanic/teichoic acid biosynthesis glycosyltransferase